MLMANVNEENNSKNLWLLPEILYKCPAHDTYQELNGTVEIIWSISEGTRKALTGQSNNTGNILVLKLGDGFVGVYLIAKKIQIINTYIQNIHTYKLVNVLLKNKDRRNLTLVIFQVGRNRERLSLFILYLSVMLEFSIYTTLLKIE